MIKEINPIQYNKWQDEFIKSSFYNGIIQKYRHVVCSYRDVTVLKAALNDTVYEKSRDFCVKEQVLDIVPYYYIKPIIETNPKVIVDLGCGLNIFKEVWPNIVGIDADPNSRYDILDHFDGDFVQGHREYCDALISINAMHFSSVDTVAERLVWCANILKPNGMAFIAFNLETWLMYTNRNRSIELFGQSPQFTDIINYIDKEIKSTGLNFVIYDWPVLRVPPESSIRDDLNGNIRLVFQK